MTRDPALFFQRDEFTDRFLAEYPVRCELRNGPIGRSRLHFHDGFEFYLLLEGSGSYTAGDRLYPLHAGTLTVIRPQVIHHPHSAPGQPVKRYVLSVGESYMKLLNQACPAAEGGIDALLTAPGMEAGHYFLSLPRLDRACSLLEELASCLRDRQPKRELAALRCLSEFLLLAIDLKDDAGALETGKTEDERLIGDVLSYLVAHYDEPLRIDDLLERFPVSRSRLFALFKQKTGHTVKQFLAEYRLNKAKAYLAGTSLPVMEVASRTGFGDLSHFFHLFKKEIGLTPLQYRSKASGRRGT
ncbi:MULTISPECIES: AraC family transcriptional regulator [Cohnella]|uniref:AraC family transcriptional regulator n=1 Tax=Cohnella TaxID=329857 RepID=UPI0009BA5FA1|nr:MULTISPECIES: AraC family transcriptional regulator [Cohnella]MBN2984964.1 helix-turn-helix transcriptional regulator [Cohnella algarum]